MTEPVPTTAMPANAVRLLVAEDDPAVQRVVQGILAARWQVEVVGDGAAALRSCRSQPPDLLVADLLMPELDGFELLRELRLDPATRTLPVIVLSGLSEEADRVRALEAGATDFLIKPFSGRELQLRVSTQLEMARLRHETLVREHQAHLQDILDSALDAVVGLDAQGRVSYWNGQAERVFGWPRAEALGRPLATFVASGLDLRGESLGRRTEVTARHRDGRQFPLEIAVNASGSAASWRYTAFARDITESREAEAERVRLLEEAREANRLKDEFLATLSHELRTPLNAIVGWAHILRTGTLDPAGVTRAVETIDRNARIQNQLIGDILDISRITAGKLHLDMRSTDLRKVIEAAIDTVRPSADAKSIRLVYSLDNATGPAWADPDRMQQVIWNLLSNAIKFTPAGGQVQVSLRPVGTQAEIAVQDTGAGIGAEFLPHVFERFRQADGSTSRRLGGLGLGLAIVHHLVEMHGGSVEARSAGQGQGATFVVRVPLLTASAWDAPGRIAPLADASAGLDEAPRLDGLRILLVDDEPDARELVAAVLGQRGASVLTASTASEALLMVQASLPDVLVCDLGLPGEDGYSLIRRVRSLPSEAGGRTPATALTAYGQAEDRMKALLAGFQMHVVKPAQPIELVTVVASLAERRRT